MTPGRVAVVFGCLVGVLIGVGALHLRLREGILVPVDRSRGRASTAT